jgi:hypothetical protein
MNSLIAYDFDDALNGALWATKIRLADLSLQLAYLSSWQCGVFWIFSAKWAGALLATAFLCRSRRSH